MLMNPGWEANYCFICEDPYFSPGDEADYGIHTLTSIYDAVKSQCTDAKLLRKLLQAAMKCPD